ncbi:hypothetical protein CRYUN_Cryun17cG0137100 [Craigia yunnanensis]
MEMPSSFSYNNKLNRDSSSKVSSSATINSAVGERRKDQTVHGDTTIFLNPNPPQTLDHHPLYQPELNPHHQIHKPRIDPDLDLDPYPVSAPIATTSATVTATANRSSLKSPQQQPPISQPPPVAGPISTTISSNPLIRYRQCLKNHATSMGGHVVDGCGEFMPSGEEGTPEALKCAACECHRNFHRKEINGESQYAPSCYYTYNPNKNNTRRDTVHPPFQLHPQQPTPLHQPRFSLGLSTSPTMTIAPVMMNFGGGSDGGPAESSSEYLNMFHSNAGGQSSHPQLSKKRFRTKFSQEQKNKMMEFAEKLGWRIQKQDEQVQQFCAQVGVKRQVFKVWMHNNKQAMKKRQM